MADRKTGDGQRRGGAPQQPVRPPGYAIRAAAARIVGEVIGNRRALDDAMERAYSAPGTHLLEQRDRAFSRLIAVTVLRRLGSLEAVLSGLLEKPLPARTGLLWPILLCATAQLLCLGTAPHAAISLAVDQARADNGARRFDRLVNAVLRRVSREGADKLAALDSVRLDTPEWLWARWEATYGADGARAIAAASAREAALDVSVKSDAGGWADRLGGLVLPTGSVRLANHGRIEDLAGYAAGQWWVQDAAAALPGRLLRNVSGLEVADLCAAPGGKTAELAAAGARVTAVDQSAARLMRLRDNLTRLALTAEVVTADVTTWAPGRLFDAVLLDAPCTATGTIRRHPDIWRLKRKDDVAELAVLQARLLEASARLVRPGGLLVYCTCSLEPEEGVDQIDRFLSHQRGFVREPVAADDVGGLVELISPIGDLRTLPFHLDGLGGLDGFYAARLRRAG